MSTSTSTVEELHLGTETARRLTSDLLHKQRRGGLMQLKLLETHS